MSASIAFSEFKESLSMAEELLKIEKNNYNNPPRVTELKPVCGLRGGVAVLVVAAFENFLKDCIEEYLSKLTTHPPVLSAFLPDKMRICNTYNTLERAMKGPLFGDRPVKKDRLIDIEMACKKIFSGIINPAAFNETGGNPNVNCVKLMMKDMDIDDIFGRIKNKFEIKWKKPVAHTFIEDKLNEIVNRRHLVAHTANALNITRGQLNESIKCLKILAEIIEIEVKNKTTQLLRSVKTT